MKYPNGCGLTNGEIPNNHEKVKKMSIEYMKTTKETKAGIYKMRRGRDTVIVYLQPKIGGEDYVGENAICRLLRVGEMKREIHAEKYELAGISRWSLSKTDTWKATNVKISHRNPEPHAAESWMQTYAEDESFHAASTPSALKEFVRTYDDFITRTLLKVEGEVFNPITNETRVHFINVLNEPLEETWVRISDDEEALARIWNNEFKKLAGAILPVKAWKCDDHHARPQRNVWASFDHGETKAYGMTSGVALPPHLWTIIDPDTEYTFSDEQMSYLEPEPVEEVKGMSDEFWNITLRLGAWTGKVSLPKSIFGTAESAINQALCDIEVANDQRADGAEAVHATNPEHMLGSIDFTEASE